MSDASRPLSGRTAIVTGASSGIGRAIADRLAGAGAVVFAASRRREGAAPAASSGDLRAVELDVRDDRALQALVERAVAETGTLNIMVNNAGLNYPDTILRGAMPRWREMFEVNVLGLLAGAQAAARAMLAGGFSGHIVNISSIAGRREGAGVYGATKAAVNTIGESLRLELQDAPIRVVQIMPGAVITNFPRNYPPEMVNGLLQTLGARPAFEAGAHMPDDVIQAVEANARAVFATADDIARAVLFAVTQPPELSVFEMVVRPAKDLPVGEVVYGPE